MPGRRHSFDARSDLDAAPQCRAHGAAPAEHAGPGAEAGDAHETYMGACLDALGSGAPPPTPPAAWDGRRAADVRAQARRTYHARVAQRRAQAYLGALGGCLRAPSPQEHPDGTAQTDAVQRDALHQFVSRWGQYPGVARWLGSLRLVLLFQTRRPVPGARKVCWEVDDVAFIESGPEDVACQVPLLLGRALGLVAEPCSDALPDVGAEASSDTDTHAGAAVAETRDTQRPPGPSSLSPPVWDSPSGKRLVAGSVSTSTTTQTADHHLPSSTLPPCHCPQVRVWSLPDRGNRQLRSLAEIIPSHMVPRAFALPPTTTRRSSSHPLHRVLGGRVKGHKGPSRMMDRQKDLEARPGGESGEDTEQEPPGSPAGTSQIGPAPSSSAIRLPTGKMWASHHVRPAGWDDQTGWWREWVAWVVNVLRHHLRRVWLWIRALPYFP